MTNSAQGTRTDWPDLTLDTWADTHATLHLWTQIVGKVRLALTPMLNQWWQVPLYLSARGLTTSLMHTPWGVLDIEFDFVDHVLRLRSAAAERQVRLEPRTVADFYDATMRALAELGMPVTILPLPQEIPDAIPFEEDDVHRSYDADAVQRYWTAMLRSHEVMVEFRSRFVGKASPVHFFWGAADLAVTRFSGRTAPKHPGGVPNCADWVQELAYSEEVSSCGFWAGGSEEGSYYSYAYPAPAGFGRVQVASAEAYFDDQLGEFLLPYRAVRTAADPAARLREFFETTYRAAADLAHWPREALEVDWRPWTGR
jgi:hypothetical protein